MKYLIPIVILAVIFSALVVGQHFGLWAITTTSNVIGIAHAPETPYQAFLDLEAGLAPPYCREGYGGYCENFEELQLTVTASRNLANMNLIGFGYNTLRNRFGDTMTTPFPNWLEDADAFSIQSIDLLVECDDGNIPAGSVRITNPRDPRITYKIEGMQELTINPYTNPQIVIRAGIPYFQLDMVSITDGMANEEYCKASGTIYLTKAPAYECYSDSDCTSDCFGQCAANVCSYGSQPAKPCDNAVWNGMPSCSWDTSVCLPPAPAFPWGIAIVVAVIAVIVLLGLKIGRIL